MASSLLDDMPLHGICTFMQLLLKLFLDNLLNLCFLCL